MTPPWWSEARALLETYPPTKALLREIVDVRWSNFDSRAVLIARSGAAWLPAAFERHAAVFARAISYARRYPSAVALEFVGGVRDPATTRSHWIGGAGAEEAAAGSSADDQAALVRSLGAGSDWAVTVALTGRGWRVRGVGTVDERRIVVTGEALELEDALSEARIELGRRRLVPGLEQLAGAASTSSSDDEDEYGGEAADVLEARWYGIEPGSMELPEDEPEDVDDDRVQAEYEAARADLILVGVPEELVDEVMLHPDGDPYR